MKLPRVVKFRDVKVMFARWGVQTIVGKSRGHKRKRHAMLVGPDGVKYPIPAHNDNDDVYRTYIRAARRRFHLTAEDGVTDEDFYQRGQ